MKQIIKELPNGDLYRIDVEDSYQDPMQAADARMAAAASGIAGQNQCSYCRQVFTSGGTLADHIKIRHSVAAGLEDMRPVPMPDGSTQPASLVPELTADHMAIMEEEAASKFEAREAELVERLEASQQQNTTLASKLEELAARLNNLEKPNGPTDESTS